MSAQDFKPALDTYKYSSRYEEGAGDMAREEASIFLYALDDQLDGQKFLHGDEIGASDLAVLPFIRQFAHVDLNWFERELTFMRKLSILTFPIDSIAIPH